MGLRKLIKFLKKKGRSFFNHGSFFKHAGQCFKNPKDENFSDPSALKPLSGCPYRVTVDKMIAPNDQVKEHASIEGSSAIFEILKIAQTKAATKDKMSTNDPHRTVHTDCAFKMVLLGKGTVEVDEISLRLQFRRRQMALHSSRVHFA